MELGLEVELEVARRSIQEFKRLLTSNFCNSRILSYFFFQNIN